MLQWLHRWRAERRRKQRVRVERRMRAQLQRVQEHLESHAGINSVSRGDFEREHAWHVQLHMGALQQPTPVALCGLPDSRTDAERLEDERREES